MSRVYDSERMTIVMCDEQAWFVKAVMNRLPQIIDKRDHDIVVTGVKGMYREGWSVGDACAFNMCLEEVVPGQDEEVALARMACIKSKYEMSGLKNFVEELLAKKKNV